MLYHFHLHMDIPFLFRFFAGKVIKSQPIVHQFQWAIDVDSFRIAAFITGSIQESLIMNQANGQA